jgi:uncharacterized protein (DUF2235 family)
MKRLIVCCDGTWQKLSSGYPTNVVKIAQAITPQATNGIPQIIFYDEGIGTGDLVDKTLGGAFGWGIDQNIKDAYRFLCLNYNEGDEIYLYGFSRGAYTVRSLAGLIYCSGLLARNKIRETHTAYELYRDSNIRREHPEAIEFRQKNAVHLQNGDDVPIKLLGCWDTVGSLGIPDQIPLLPIDEWINEKYDFHNTTLSPIIENALHAVAIDEHRKVFDVTPMVKDPSNTKQNLLQVWFPGNHGCVGGGTEEQSGLSDGALKWMIDKSHKIGGLEFDEKKVPEGINPDPIIPFDNTLKRISALSGKNLRKVSDDWEDLHESVKERWIKSHLKFTSEAMDSRTNLPYNPENLPDQHKVKLAQSKPKAKSKAKAKAQQRP